MERYIDCKGSSVVDARICTFAVRLSSPPTCHSSKFNEDGTLTVSSQSARLSCKASQGDPSNFIALELGYPLPHRVVQVEVINKRLVHGKDFTDTCYTVDTVAGDVASFGAEVVSEPRRLILACDNDRHRDVCKAGTQINNTAQSDISLGCEIGYDGREVCSREWRDGEMRLDWERAGCVSKVREEKKGVNQCRSRVGLHCEDTTII